MADSFGELEAASLFCPRCKQANPVRKALLLVLPNGNKYDYACSVCGTQVGGKTDSESRGTHDDDEQPPPRQAKHAAYTLPLPGAPGQLGVASDRVSASGAGAR